MLEIRKTKRYGRGVYATRFIAAGEVIESSPVLILDDFDAKQIVSTILNCYVFAWGEKEQVALALGFGSLFNHSRKENITYQNNHKNSTIEFIALRDIEKSEQLFIDYGYSVKTALKVTKDNKELAKNAT